MSSFPSNSSSAVRFLGLLKQPDSDTLELLESDVVWSSSDDRLPDSVHSHSTESPPPSAKSAFSPPNNNIGISHHNHLQTVHSGLSAALFNDDYHPLVRQKSTLNPSSLSATSTARTIRTDRSRNRKFCQSVPLNVPIWNKISRRDTLDSELFDEVDDNEEEMVPPHEIVARSHVTFSVFEGVGRTLKGRDLRRVRNAVFQSTGFLE